MTQQGDHRTDRSRVARALAEYLDALDHRWHELTDDERRSAVRVASDAAWRVAGRRRRRR